MQAKKPRGFDYVTYMEEIGKEKKDEKEWCYALAFGTHSNTD